MTKSESVTRVECGDVIKSLDDKWQIKALLAPEIRAKFGLTDPIFSRVRQCQHCTSLNVGEEKTSNDNHISWDCLDCGLTSEARFHNRAFMYLYSGPIDSEGFLKVVQGLTEPSFAQLAESIEALNERLDAMETRLSDVEASV